MIKGIIFDMDGVISDTQKLHSRVESEILSRFGINLSPAEITDSYSGVKTREFFNDLLSLKGVKYDLDSLMVEKWNKMTELANQTVDPVSDIYDLIDLCKEMNFNIAVGTASTFDYAFNVLKALKIFDKFDSIVSSDMVSKGKPEPDIFLLAATNINLDPVDCIVIEDGISGMIAANRADMKCIALVKKIDFDKYPTKNQVLSLKDINRSFLLSL